MDQTVLSRSGLVALVLPAQTTPAAGAAVHQSLRLSLRQAAVAASQEGRALVSPRVVLVAAVPGRPLALPQTPIPQALALAVKATTAALAHRMSTLRRIRLAVVVVLALLGKAQERIQAMAATVRLSTSQAHRLTTQVVAALA